MIRLAWGLLISAFTCCTFQAQQATTGIAEATGRCSAVVTGSRDQVVINCDDIPKGQAQGFTGLLNQVLARQLDPILVISKLDDISKGQRNLTQTVELLNKKVDKLENSRRLKTETQYLFQDIYEFAREWDAYRPTLPREAQGEPHQIYFDNWAAAYAHWMYDKGPSFRLLFGKRISFLIDKLQRAKIDPRSLSQCTLEQPSTDDFNACGTALFKLSLTMAD